MPDEKRWKQARKRGQPGSGTTLSLLWGWDRQTTEGAGEFFGGPPIERL
jgi:hypothetical protein